MSHNSQGLEGQLQTERPAAGDRIGTAPCAIAQATLASIHLGVNGQVATSLVQQAQVVDAGV